MTKAPNLFMYLLLVLILILVGCSIFNQDDVEIKVKQVVKLPTGTIIEASAPLNMTKVIDALMPRVGDNKVEENSSFVIPIEIKNVGDKDFVNTKLMFSYEGEFINGLYLYSWSKSPLQKVDEKIYEFDKDLKATQATKVIVAGSVNKLPDGLADGRVSFSLSILDNGNNVIATTKDSIVITKQKREIQ